MQISLVDEALGIHTKVSLSREAEGWVKADIKAEKCRIPAKEHFLLSDATEDSVAFESTLLPRAAYFQYAYRRHMHRERPDLLSCAENVEKADQMLRRYGAVLALRGSSLEDCIEVNHPDPECCQYKAMMALISEGYRDQLRSEETLHAQA